MPFTFFLPGSQTLGLEVHRPLCYNESYPRRKLEREERRRLPVERLPEQLLPSRLPPVENTGRLLSEASVRSPVTRESSPSGSMESGDEEKGLGWDTRMLPAAEGDDRSKHLPKFLRTCSRSAQCQALDRPWYRRGIRGGAGILDRVSLTSPHRPWFLTRPTLVPRPLPLVSGVRSPRLWPWLPGLVSLCYRLNVCVPPKFVC